VLRLSMVWQEYDRESRQTSFRRPLPVVAAVETLLSSIQSRLRLCGTPAPWMAGVQRRQWIAGQTSGAV
jgi:hypothetical protein